MESYACVAEKEQAVSWFRLLGTTLNDYSQLSTNICYDVTYQLEFPGQCFAD